MYFSAYGNKHHYDHIIKNIMNKSYFVTFILFPFIMRKLNTYYLIFFLVFGRLAEVFIPLEVHKGMHFIIV